MKDYETICEYCGGTECDGMVCWEDLDFDYEEMYRDKDKENNEKKEVHVQKSYLHQTWTCWCREEEEIAGMFPTPEGMSLMEHRESWTDIRVKVAEYNN